MQRIQNVQDRAVALGEFLPWRRSGNIERSTQLASVRMDTVWSSTRTIYAKDTRKDTTVVSTMSLGAVSIQGAEALEEETATRDELRMRCTVIQGGTAVASFVESAIEIAIEDGRPRITAPRQMDTMIPSAVYSCIMHLWR